MATSAEDMLSPSPEDEEPSDTDAVLDSLLIAGLAGLFASTPNSPEFSSYEDEEFEASEAGGSSQDDETLTENACFKELSSQKELRARRQATRFTTEYLVRFIARLNLPTLAERRNVIRRLTSALCHQTLSIDGIQRPALAGWAKMRQGTAARATEFMEVLHDAVCENAASVSQRDRPLQKQNGTLANGASTSREKTFRGINIMASAIAR
ncbi:hypothetical protein V5799_010626 [Amblyomma americanum]|uniref:Uncharacterized protein n=1 Tax=Amblyomma americanum TaxID=6943 RepID=A0AAQ4EJN4_AMBAM